MGYQNIFQEKQAKDIEDLFFLQQDKKLIEQLHKLERMKETKQALASVSGITNDEVLQKLVELNIRPEILATLAMIPLIEVAWADGSVDEKEKKAVIDAASESFVSKDSPDFAVLQSWMEHKPEPKLLEAWIHYMQGLCEKLTEHQKNALKKDLLGHARQVAEAAGGFLGFGSKISDTEQQMLGKLEAAFNKVK
jgi:hypothetical protein